MDLESLLYEIDTTKTIENSSEVSRAMNDVASETRRLCMVLNTGVYTDAEIREQFSHIIGKTVDSEFRLSLPFTTDFGKNIIVGKKCLLIQVADFRIKAKLRLVTIVSLGIMSSLQPLITTLNRLGEALYIYNL